MTFDIESVTVGIKMAYKVLSRSFAGSILATNDVLVYFRRPW